MFSSAVGDIFPEDEVAKAVRRLQNCQVVLVPAWAADPKMGSRNR